jgi:hypothetical protein
VDSWHCVDSKVSASIVMSFLAVRCQLRMCCHLSSKVPAPIVCVVVLAVRCQLRLSCHLSSKVLAAFCCCAILLNEEWPENELIG